ncbi:MAG: glycoside hydrolase family 13 protein [Bacillota bacterium]|uniref:Alpha-amylase n=1 Tax=Virgibacillus salarius TaxID=447199 RepID=A0A941DSY6_9BACI|nr:MULTISPECIES: alpha-glucosidase [Bacillaceae]NAZ08756.1 alpha,alpha-phosphotrehalase [Agaribacter marinus]MBR7796045.1 alpha-glucosidase [Virgibacillus salarius]MCC2252043.1 alpha-glucosidase [Virgibacillus sp. AGTR]MDY7045257.1 alpha-glucosidase [Virgibacillus sp. M23]QRZ18255.1 alpha-glucosidase [Virgibacillus sp. AGTR]
MKKVWWKEAVAYQVYPRSFMDADGDGIGDIQGVISKLDYLEGLGIDVIWLSPVYQSPNDDNGYDISDYQAIMSEFGTMNDFDQLLEEVHQRGMKLIMDLVINHTSDEHPWFIESRSSKNNPYRDYYIWQEGKNGTEPNNWESIFGGSAWEYDDRTESYYLHVFSRKQPDLNWENPAVRQSLYSMVNWWLDKGIDGFRVDAISHIKKVPGFPDMPNPDNRKYVPSFAGHMNREGIHVFLQELKNETFDQYDIMTVGEANGVTMEDAALWVGEEKGKFNMVFQFEHLDLWGKSITGGLDIHALKETLTKWQKGLEGVGWNALFLENHDQTRSVSSWGNDDEYWKVSAKGLATLYFLMQGTPFIYQGQEIGMTNVQFPAIEDYNDVAMKNLYAEEIEKGTSHQEIMEIIWEKGRDNSRTPMQWNGKENAGFTTGQPWMKVNPNYRRINVSDQLADPTSIYHYYKQLIHIRKQYSAFIYGSYNLVLADHDQVYGYTRTDGDQQMLILVNLFEEEADVNVTETLIVSSAKLLISNYDVENEEQLKNMVLKPYEARVYRLYNWQ